MADDRKNLIKFADVILKSGILFFILLFFYSVYKTIARLDYRWIIAYYIISLIGVTIFVAALKLREELRLNFSILVLAVFIGIYVLEIGLQLFSPQYFREEYEKVFLSKERMKVAKRQGIPFDERSKLQVTEDLRKQGIDAWPLINPIIFIDSDGLNIVSGRFYPLTGISQKIIVTCNEEGKRILYKSDEYGFNNPGGLYIPGDVDIVFIGDSFTIGACVEQEETVGGILRKKGYKAISLGRGGMVH